MELLEKALKESMRKMGLEKTHEVSTLQTAWAKIVGKKASLNSRPTTIRQQALIIETSSPAWSHHLAMIKNKIIERTAKEMIEITDVRFEANMETGVVEKLQEPRRLKQPKHI